MARLLASAVALLCSATAALGTRFPLDGRAGAVAAFVAGASPGSRVLSPSPLLVPPNEVAPVPGPYDGPPSGPPSRAASPVRTETRLRYASSVLDGDGVVASTTFLGHLDGRVRGVLLCWGLTDKVLRSLQLAQSKDLFFHRTEHTLAAASADLHAIEVVAEALEGSEIDRSTAEGEDAHRVRQAMVRNLRTDFEARAEQLADFALGLGPKTIDDLRTEVGEDFKLRITDGEVECDDDGDGCRPTGDHIDLSGDELVAAAGMDVTGTLGVLRFRPGPRLHLLGLVAALGHARVFDLVQRRLRATAERRTIEEFLHDHGSTSVAGLVSKFIQEYHQPSAAKKTYTTLYAMTSLRAKPVYFQIAWGFKRAAAALKDNPMSPRALKAVRAVLGAAPWVQVTFYVRKLMRFSRAVGSHQALTAIDHLRATSCFLSLILICHSQLHVKGVKFTEKVAEAVKWARHDDAPDGSAS